MNNVITSYFNRSVQKAVTVEPEATFRTVQGLLQAGAEYVGIRKDIDGSVPRFFRVIDEEILEIADPSMR